MRRIRFAVLAIASFVTVLIATLLSPGTWLNRALSAAICTIFSFNSTFCLANLARSSGQVMAANPPNQIATRPEFHQSDSKQPQTPATNPQAAPASTQPSPNTPLHPEFNNPAQNPTHTSPNQTHTNLAGIWLYSIYDSSTANKPMLRIPIKVEEDNQHLLVSECSKSCDEISLNQSYFFPKKLKDDSLIVNDNSITIETVESEDEQAIWGIIRDSISTKELYFSINQISLLLNESSNNKRSYQTNLPSKSNAIYTDSNSSLPTLFSQNINGEIRRNISSELAFNSGCISSIAKATVQQASKMTKNLAEAQQEAMKLTPQGARLVEQKVALDQFNRLAAIEYRTFLNSLSQLGKQNIKSFNSCIDLKDLRTLARIGSRLGVILAEAALIAVAASVTEWCVKNPEDCALLATHPGATARAIGNQILPKTGQCGQQQVSGGQAGDRRTIKLTASRGKISISYNMNQVPDRLQVVYEGREILDTGFISSTGTREVSFEGNSSEVTVILTGNPTSETKWDYTLSCPQ